MRAGACRANRQCRVQKKNPLRRPMFKVSQVRNGSAEVVADFLIDILKRRRNWRFFRNRKTKTVRLPHAVILVLPQNDDAYFVVGAEFKGVEYILGRWKYPVLHIFPTHKFGKFF